ncbi:hypothetical protein A9973_11250 [Achromobacter sp. UMC46]|nr:hypothetical protein [Achromobacter sp. UMC46]
MVNQVAKAGPPEDRADQLPNLEDCADSWPQYLAFGAQTPDALGLSVSGVGHASGACLGTHATVPFKALTPCLKPDGQVYLQD